MASEGSVQRAAGSGQRAAGANEFLERRREMGSRGVGRAQQPQPPPLNTKGESRV